MTMTEAGGVFITNKDLYDKLSDVEKAVNLMTPQAQMLADHEGRIRVNENQIPHDLHARLRSLEKWKWSIPPTFVAAAIAIVDQLLFRKG
jgi:hypothetical protein